mgnify:CR=1 FL=1
MTEKTPFHANPDLIGVVVEPAYLSDHSDPQKNHYSFSYTITVSNSGDCIVQLLSRHWIITDADGDVQEVRGEGVVGKKPLISPNESFRYTSWVSIKTPIGTMTGTYIMIPRSNDLQDVSRLSEFEVPIPLFSIQQIKVLH